jgi:hypothetical protein
MVLEIEHLVSRAETKPVEEGRREQGRVSASGAIDFDKIAPPEILDAGRIERNHLLDSCSLFVRQGRIRMAPLFVCVQVDRATADNAHALHEERRGEHPSGNLV